ncbi:MAG: radical SAM protein, partial [Arcobacter butzleri]|nr:radical SAM protein [Aliarcobacter butzleri]
MDLELFDTICHQAKEFTNEIYLHLLGDPLVLSNLQDYLDIAYKYS